MKSLFVVTALLLMALGLVVPATLSQGASNNMGMDQNGSQSMSTMPSANSAAGQPGSSSSYANQYYTPYMDWASIPPSYCGRTDRSAPQFLGLNQSSCANSATIGGMGSC